MFARRLRTVFAALALVALTAVPAYADPPAAPVPPANDDVAGATLVGALPFTDTVDATLASPEPGEQLCSAAAHTVWYELTPDVTFDLRVFADGGEASNPLLRLWRETPAGLAPVTSSCTTSSLRAVADAGETYLLQVGLQAFDAGIVTVTVTRATSMTGRVTNANGDPIADVCVDAESDDPDLFYPFGYGLTDANGEYKITDLEPAEYRVGFYPCGNDAYAVEWYDNAYAREDADLVSVVEHQITSGIDAVLEVPAFVTGRLTSNGHPVQECVSGFDPSGRETGFGYSYGDGTYTMIVGGGGPIKVRFGCSFAGAHHVEWYDDVATEADATVVTTTPGETVSGIDADLAVRVAPPNDMIAAATVVGSLPFSASADVYRATTQSGEPKPCGTSSFRTVWYSFTPDRDGMVAINTRGSTTSAILGVYTGQLVPEGLQTVACNHHSTRGGDQIGFNAKEGVKYYVQMGTSFAGVMQISIDWAQDVSNLEFAAGTPCLVLCPYWSDPQAESEVEREATCASSPASPEGSWSDVTVEVPSSVDIDGGSAGVPTELVFTLTPDVDHDSWICRETPDEDGNRYVATGANTTSEMCVVGPITCSEQITIPVTPGERFILRIYNWSDTSHKPRAAYGYKVQRP